MIIDCAYCQGTGRKFKSRYKNDICPVCDGSGEVEVPDNARKCNYCEGTGRRGRSNDDNWTEICPACNGTGVKKIVKYE